MERDHETNGINETNENAKWTWQLTLAIRAGPQASRLRVLVTESIEIYDFVFCD